MLFEHLHDSTVIRVVFGVVLQLIAAGAERSGGRVEQKAQLVLVFQIQIIQDVIQNAPDAVGGAVDVGDGVIVQSSTDHAVCAGVDDSGGAAGLCNQAGTNEFVHVCSPLVVK